MLLHELKHSADHVMTNHYTALWYKHVAPASQLWLILSFYEQWLAAMLCQVADC